jgi:hypothetical protein
MTTTKREGEGLRLEMQMCLEPARGFCLEARRKGEVSRRTRVSKPLVCFYFTLFYLTTKTIKQTARMATATIPAGAQPPQQPQGTGLDDASRVPVLSFSENPRDDLYGDNDNRNHPSWHPTTTTTTRNGARDADASRASFLLPSVKNPRDDVYSDNDSPGVCFFH